MRLPPATLGVIGNGHFIKLGRNGEHTVRDHSFECAFDKADSAFPDFIKWLDYYLRPHLPGAGCASKRPEPPRSPPQPQSRHRPAS